MRLYDQNAKVGDKVYDILEGDGTITVVDNASIAVSFGNSTVYSYNSAGNRVGNTPARFPPLLYWHNPIVMIPTKEDKKWETMKEILFNLYKVIGRV